MEVMEKSWSFSDWCRNWSRPLLLPVARFFAHLGLTPNGVTILCLFSYACTGIALGLGFPVLAGFMLAVLGPLDAVDGLLAREQGKETKTGAFLDSTLDRYAEVFLFAGLLYYLFQINNNYFLNAFLIFISITGSILVSYNRARAEALGFSCKVGLLTRFERLLILAIGLITGWIYPALIILSIFTHLTAIHRLIHVIKQSTAQK
jgi:CDP-diacylglycerol--glycerol-3-phosphate 3-phosphatidyltransferase